MEDWKEKASDATRLSILGRRLTLASSPQRRCTIFQTRWHVLLVQFLGMLAATFFTIERRRIPVGTSGTSGVARWLATHGSFGDFPAKLPWSCADYRVSPLCAQHTAISHYFKFNSYIPCNGSVLRELDRARNTKNQNQKYAYFPSRSLNTTDPIRQLLSITVGHILLL
jgi:hypothetical protein